MLTLTAVNNLATIYSIYKSLVVTPTLFFELKSRFYTFEICFVINLKRAFTLLTTLFALA